MEKILDLVTIMGVDGGSLRITLAKEVVKALGVGKGDKIVYIQNDKGQVIGARPSGSIVVRICAIMGFSTVLLEK